MGWEPRAKQQPTGLIAYGAARRRPAGLWLPASASCLGRRSRLASHGPNNDSLFLPQAAVVVVAVQVLLSAVAAKEKLPYKTKKTAIKSCLSCGAGMQSKSEPFPSDATSVASPKVTVCVPSL